MPEQSIYEESRKAFSIAYSGKNKLQDHSISFEILAPALLAYEKLLREANREISGKKSSGKLMVVSDFEHKCFNINFEYVLTLYDQAQSLISSKEEIDAGKILDWLEILKMPASGAASVLGYLGYLKVKNGRKIERIIKKDDSDETGHVDVKFEGDNNVVTVNNYTLNLSKNPRALAATRDMLSPIGLEGFDKIEIRDGGVIVNRISSSAANDMLTSCIVGINDSKDTSPTVEQTSAWLTVYSPVYEEHAAMWRFTMGREIIYADISGTAIAHDAIARGGAMVEDTYQVKLEIETQIPQDGKPKKPSYRVIEVLRFIPAKPEIQSELKM
ncbi:MAG: hypothetical protein COB08_016025 [Rhodobacteraceae bacterium]|nr:hypothetical protein [Paracoccaceae bacterium]